MKINFEIQIIILIFVVDLKTTKNMTKRPKAVGIYDKEIFIANFDENGNIAHFDVLRPVEASMLSDLRDADTYKEYCRELWEQAVLAGNTEESLLDFAQELIDEADVDDDEEAFPLKDESGLEYLTQEEREVADNFLEAEYGIEVGTWEASGCFPPTMETVIGTDENGDNIWGTKFKKFDLVYDFELAEQYYKTLK